jgi:DNA-binding SARP family transcriptional activator
MSPRAAGRRTRDGASFTSEVLYRSEVSADHGIASLTDDGADAGIRWPSFQGAAMPEVTVTSRRLVQIFGGPFVVRDGMRIAVPEGSRRLVVLVALAGTPVDRRQVGGQLWPCGGDARAAGNLRSALWRLNKADIGVIGCDGRLLVLQDNVDVDVHLACAWAQRLIEDEPEEEDLQGIPWPAGALDLLPGWYDDWVVFERERVRQWLLHGLEELARVLSARGRYAEAVDAALVAIATEPLRETAHRVLVHVHLAEGNVTEARRAYGLCRATFRRELGVEPSPALARLVCATAPAGVPSARVSPSSSVGVR